MSEPAWLHEYMGPFRVEPRSDCACVVDANGRVVQSEDLAAWANERGRMRSALMDYHAFVAVMFGDEDARVPETVTTPIGVPVKLGKIVREGRVLLDVKEPV